MYSNFLTALKFLTVFPYGKEKEPTEEELARSAAHFPMVGLCIGFILFILNFVLSHIFPHSIVNVFLLLSLVVISGGLHLDGFTDVVDGFAGGYTKEERIKIMKDSAIGVFGVCGVVFILLLKFVSLNNLSPDVKAASLFIIPMGGRLSIVFLSYLSHYIEGKEGIGRTFTENVKEREFWIAAGVGGMASIVFMGRHGVLMVIALFVFSVLFAKYSKHKIGGATGDTLGAVSEISELIVILFAVIIDNNIGQFLFDGVWL